MSQLQVNSKTCKALPLTEAQREIWYGAQVSDGLSCSFNQSVMVLWRGPLDLGRLDRAIQALVERHEALRVALAPGGESQYVHPSMSVEIPFLDLCEFSPEARNEQIQRLLQEEASEPFDLVQGPLLRVGLARLGAAEHVLFLTLHHIVCDGCGLGFLLQELAELYDSSRGQETALEPLECSYSEFVDEEEKSMATQERAEAERYWLEKFANPVTELRLPLDHPRPTKRRFGGGTEQTVLGRSLTQSLRQWSAQQHCTLMTTLLAGYYLLLHRLSGEADIVIGLPMSRRSASCGRLVGHCVNFLPLRYTMDLSLSGRDFVHRVWEMLLEAHQHANFTLGTLLPKLKWRTERNRMPLTPVMFNVDGLQPSILLHGVETEVQANPYCNVRFDLSLSASEFESELKIECQFGTELFEAEAIDQWLDHYQKLLGWMVNEPEQPVAALVARLPVPKGAQPSEEEEAMALEPAETAGPLTAVEEQVAGIWEEVIGLSEIGPNDNFFDIGGHSLLATQVVSRIAKVFHVDLSLRTIFEAPTIASLAEAIATAQREQPEGSGIIRSRRSQAEELLKRLDDLSEAELQELLQNPDLTAILS